MPPRRKIAPRHGKAGPMRQWPSVVAYGDSVPNEYWSTTEGDFVYPPDIGRPKLRGDYSLVPDIERARDSARDIVGPMVARAVQRWAESGSGVSVSRFLSGDPRCMRRRAIEPSEVGPVRIIATGNAWCGRSLPDLARRAGVICACVESLAMVRPVSLVAYLATDCRVLWDTWPVDDPTDLAAVGAAIGPAALRGPGIASLRRGKSGGPFAQEFDVRQAFGAGPNDILIPTWGTGDTGSPEDVLRRFRGFLESPLDEE